MKLLLAALGIALSAFLGLLLWSFAAMSRFSMDPVPPPVPGMQLMAETAAAVAIISLFTISLITVVRVLRDR